MKVKLRKPFFLAKNLQKLNKTKRKQVIGMEQIFPEH
jgi:hypothetical protein